jgi:hypothetical protein
LNSGITIGELVGNMNEEVIYNSKTLSPHPTSSSISPLEDNISLESIWDALKGKITCGSCGKSINLVHSIVGGEKAHSLGCN